ncbi:MAG: helix-turn-helix transcriptional regulator [Ruminococcaceae bacterium]|nr:helix-turn-helix transcriptional regulator [Oscillospiraceae bacterium]
MTNTEIGSRIREVREKTKLNQKEFCAVLEIPQSTLSAYETGRMQPTIASLVNIATKFNISLDWLCGVNNTGNNNGLPDDLSAALNDAEEYLRELKARRKDDNEKMNALHKELLTKKKKGRGGK